MPVKYQEYITRKDIQNNPECIYVFGDNEARVGTGGQAKEMRGEPNSIGIRTKREPLFAERAYWTDEEYLQNTVLITEDLDEIYKHLWAGKTVVFPIAGIGTGLAELETRAPKTFVYLQNRLAEMFDEYLI